VAFKLVDEIGDERSAKSWLQKERDVSPGLSIVEWKPKAESSGILSWFVGSIAPVLGVPANKIADLAGQLAAGLKLDGLVSLWHPAGG
jgi:protease-4